MEAFFILGRDLTSGVNYSCGTDMVRCFSMTSGSKPAAEAGRKRCASGWDVVEYGIEARRGCERLREVARGWEIVSSYGEKRPID